MIEKRASHCLEFPDFIPQDILRQLKMSGKAGNTEKLLGTAVDHFFSETDIIPREDGAAVNAPFSFSHELVPSGRYTASCHDREPSD